MDDPIAYKQDYDYLSILHSGLSIQPSGNAQLSRRVERLWGDALIKKLTGLPYQALANLLSSFFRGLALPPVPKEINPRVFDTWNCILKPETKNFIQQFNNIEIVRNSLDVFLGCFLNGDEFIPRDPVEKTIQERSRELIPANVYAQDLLNVYLFIYHAGPDRTVLRVVFISQSWVDVYSHYSKDIELGTKGLRKLRTDIKKMIDRKSDTYSSAFKVLCFLVLDKIRSLLPLFEQKPQKHRGPPLRGLH